MTIYAVRLPRLLDGVADALAADVLPYTSDHYAQLQLRAIIELLRNLGDRVGWEQAPIDAKVRATEAALAALGADAHGPEPREEGIAALRAAREQLSRFIDALYAAGEPDPAAASAIWEAIRTDFDDEADAIRTGALPR